MGCRVSRLADDATKPKRPTKPKPNQPTPTPHDTRRLSLATQPAPAINASFNAVELADPHTKRNSRRSSAAAANPPPSQPLDRIGTFTLHGLVPTYRGGAAAKINQDRGVVVWPFNGSFNEALLCVFDGHGQNGELVAEYCLRRLPKLLAEAPGRLADDPAALLRDAINGIDCEVLTGSLASAARVAGSALVVVYQRGDAVWTACAGDSRAVLGSVRGAAVLATNLSEDCKPDTPAERERIVRAGGVVSPAVGSQPARVWAAQQVGLAMSRSIGDGKCKEYGVISDPDIRTFTLRPPETAGADGDRHIIVASDGVWEFIDSQEACDIVARSGASANDASASLVEAAAQRWRINEGTYRDDITAIVVNLPYLRAQAVGAEEIAPLSINLGEVGIELPPAAAEGEGEGGAGEGGAANGEDAVASDADDAAADGDFAKRRLSAVHNVGSLLERGLASIRALGGSNAEALEVA